MARYDTIIGVSRRNRVQQALRARAEKAAIIFTRRRRTFFLLKACGALYFCVVSLLLKSRAL
nr:MAG TPA: hypothetical protein [Bacteriophage sp.]